MKKLSIWGLFLALAIVACKTNKSESPEEKEAAMEMETNNQNDWVWLFNGENLDGWHAYNKNDISDQWQVKDETLVFTPAQNRSGTENLVTDKEYEDFILSLEWKISEGGNSGVMWGVQEMEQYNEPYYTGPEIQVLDNERHPDAKAGTTHQAGALYDMVEPSQNVVKPAGEWNHYLIKVDHKNNQGSVTLNGTEIVTFPVHGEEWEKMVADSKFADWENFGKFRTGMIALQDHDNKVWFRNIKIKEL